MNNLIARQRTLTPEQAQAEGYHRLTFTYGAREFEMLENVIRDMEAGRIDFVLVQEVRGDNELLSVARKQMRKPYESRLTL